jgi:hypothetical protein
MLQNNLTAIAREAAEEIRRNEKRVSIPQAAFWCMVTLLVLLSVFFALVIFANIKLIILTELVFLHSILIVLILAAVPIHFINRNIKKYSYDNSKIKIPPVNGSRPSGHHRLFYNSPADCQTDYDWL